MREGLLLKRVAGAARKLLEADNLRDAHTYVGGLIAAGGVGARFGTGAGVALFGFLLVYIGLVHPLIYAVLKRRH